MSAPHLDPDLVRRICGVAGIADIAHDALDDSIWVGMSNPKPAGLALKALNAFGIGGHDLEDGRLHITGWDGRLLHWWLGGLLAGVDGLPIRPAGARTGVRRPGRVRKPSPPAAELRRLREQERLSRGELATLYQVHPQAVSGWLSAAGLSGQLPPSVSEAQVAALYRAEPIPASEIARRLGIPPSQALVALHREGVKMDPGRQSAAVRAAGVRRRGTAASLPGEQAELAVQYYQDQGWSYRMIGAELGVSHAKVRAELQRRGIPVHRRQPIGPGSRASRADALITELRKLYVESASTSTRRG